LNKKGPKQSVFVGDTVTTSTGTCTVSLYTGALDVEVTFEDGTKVRTRASDFKLGSVKNPNFPSVFGVGFIGQGPHSSSVSGGKITQCYNAWSAMMNRCYGKNKQKSYENVIVCQEWHNFQNFAKWHSENFIEGWELDKDLLGNGKLYSPQTCCYLPKELNVILRKKRVSNSKYPRGVSLLPGGSFQAVSSIRGKNTYLGVYSNPDDAWMAVKMFVEDKIKLIAFEYKPYLKETTYNSILNYEVKPHYDQE